jgi:hypothetical protein
MPWNARASTSRNLLKCEVRRGAGQQSHPPGQGLLNLTAQTYYLTLYFQQVEWHGMLLMRGGE